MDNIRFILVVTFAMLLYMLYDAWQIDYGPKREIPVAQQMPQDLKEDLPTATGEPQPESRAEAKPIVTEVTESDAIISVTTDVLSLEIDPKGGTIRNLDLLKYPREKENTAVEWVWNLFGFSKPEKDLSPIRLFDSSAERLFLAQSGLIAAEGSANAATHHSVFNFEKDQYILGDDQDTITVPLTWTNNEGLTVTKTLTFKRGSYTIGVNQTVSNDSTQPWTGRQYKQLLRVPYKEEAGHTFIRTYAGGVVYTEENKYQKVSFDDMASDKLNVKTTGGWSAMIQHYFAAAWIPPKDQENTFYTKDLKDWRYVIGSYSPAFTVEPNSDMEFSAQLFAGPKIQPMMEEIAKGLELTVDYAWLTIIAKPIYWLLNQIHGFVGNWGLSIIGVTLCIKLLFFKLSQTSFRSMAKMRKIQPRLKELQERFADDRQRFNKEMMDMYKREKVNPLGGCLPILVQIPVFISLYWVLVETVELRQAPFALWMQDLSAQDPFFILPILMGITMKIQQSLNPAPIDPLQAKIMKMFPIVFTVFFLFFPAGLVLYWVVNNTLSIIQQWYITKNLEDAK
ncbi:MAG TPA: membrane protein insertase YidC [Methylococcaceae bacterium]|nr:membrane protein insertase YidC [Methylococcaceae bacterium]